MFGFKKVSVSKTIKLVLTGYFLYLGINFIITVIVLYTNIKIPGFEISQRILPLFGKDILSLSLAGILILIVDPVLEEILFRGFILKNLVNKTGVVLGSILAALIFAGLHSQSESFGKIFILGLILNALVIKEKSIYPAIALHIFNNLIIFILEIIILKS